MNSFKRYQILCRLRDYNYYVYSNTELVYNSPFELLIAVLLSAQSKDIQVNKVTKYLFKAANTPKLMLLLGEYNIRNYIKSIGLYNTKAKNIVKICQILLEKYHGSLPSNRMELESLPGVGRKTANIILNIVFGHATIAVDTHVFRVCNRSQFAFGKTVTAVEKKLLSVVPEKFKKNCHQWLIRHGKFFCYAKKPKCSICIIKDLCEFNKK